ncbi:exosortase B [Aquabacterium olei]|uniref:Exosortase B n=2 Tax=Aquabacterium olei TaxID=1296669 RepID=A0A2U8FTR2_9BURK|nr:exosortase B [Aquabacterium olei]
MTTMSNEALGLAAHAPAKPWLPISGDILAYAIGMLGMFSFTVYDLLYNGDNALWSKGEFSHGPIMLTVAMFLLVTRWREYDQPLAPHRRDIWLSWAILAFGVLIHSVSRALTIVHLEVASFIPVIISMVLRVGGTPLLNKLKFPVFFFVFMVPLPGFITDPISQFIKMRVTEVVTELLWQAGYPITHTGVVIAIGPYQLLVADACAGMRTLFMLEAMGIFYINVVKHSSLLRNVALATLIVPISFTANVTRVIFLALLTYHFGDEVGQGFLHGFAGIVLFVAGLLFTIMIDALLRSIAAIIDKRRHAA